MSVSFYLPALGLAFPASKGYSGGMDARDWMGGAFGWEGAGVGNFPYREGERCAYVSSGRAALECLLRSMPRLPRRVWVPRFACNTLMQPLHRLGLDVRRYPVGCQLEAELPADAGKEDLLLLINYFGLTAQAVQRATAAHRGPVVVDATAALYCPPLPGIPTFYSPRKFGGLADGGIACAPFPIVLPEEQDMSAQRMQGLLLRAEAGLEAAAAAIQQAEDSLDAPPRRMSGLTRQLLGSIDWEGAARARLENYAVLHAALSSLNRLDLPAEPVVAPFCYPLVSGIPGLRDALVDAGVALPLFWPEVIDATDASETENQLARTLLPLPLDQRYGEADMRRLLELILG